jgi:quinoprotein glucose dehydrogenase
VPTDSGSPDYVGIWRPGDNAGSGSTVAIDAETGKVKWMFQNIHHDIFDLDTNAAPARWKSPKRQAHQGGGAGHQAGDDLDSGCRDGQAIHPYEERTVAQSQIPGEKTSPTQPFTILSAARCCRRR